MYHIEMRLSVPQRYGNVPHRNETVSTTEIQDCQYHKDTGLSVIDTELSILQRYRTASTTKIQDCQYHSQYDRDTGLSVPHTFVAKVLI